MRRLGISRMPRQIDKGAGEIPADAHAVPGCGHLLRGPPVTTVAHVAALVLGAVLHYIVQRCSSIGVGHDSKQDWSKT